MTLDTLSLTLAASIEGGVLLDKEALSADPALNPVFIPVLHLNGEPLFTNPDRVVDTLGLLLWSQDPGSFDLLTCTCGVAGCAGFHHEVTVAVSEGEAGRKVVEWNIPECGYSKCVSKARGAGPWTFRFDRDQLVAETDALAAQLLALEERNGAVEYTPSEQVHEFSTPAEQFSVVLARGKERRARELRADQQLTDTFGVDVIDLCLRIKLAPVEGADPKFARLVFWMPVRRLGNALLTDAGFPWSLESEEDFAEAQPVLEDGAARLRSDPIGLLLSLSEEQRSVAAYPQDETDPQATWLLGVSLQGLTPADHERLTVSLAADL